MAAPLSKSVIPGASWVLFAVLIILCIFFCWVPLLWKENYMVCPQCGDQTRY